MTPLNVMSYFCSMSVSELLHSPKIIGMVGQENIKGDNQYLECCYLIYSVSAEAKPFAIAVRGHWGIENPLHWRPDEILSDDISRIKGNATTIMTRIRNLFMNLYLVGAFFS